VQIVVNTRLLIKDRLDGIGWFTYQTLKRITRNNPGVHFVFLFDRQYHNMFVFSDNITPLILSPQARHPFLYYVWFEISVKQLLNKMKPDLFLSPDGFLSLGANCKQLPVIHDINFLHYPGDSKWLTAKYYNYFFPRFAAKAARIATVSEYSREDIAKSYHIHPSKIDVVYNGINHFFMPVTGDDKVKTRTKFAGGKEYFVSVGALHPRKNVVRLVMAFELFKKTTGSDMKLVLAGPGLWGLGDIRKAVEQSSVNTDIIFTERLSNTDLALVLGSAMALTFVPYFEGFGIPVVEAMAAGVPVITSNLTSLPEIAGEAALLVDPFNAESICNAMVRIFKEEELRKKLISEGSTRQTMFSWDRTSGLLWNSILKTVHSE
jgi:glycosyltransferase involved in cell wall biosynthesis